MPATANKIKLCKFNDDLAKGMRPALAKYIRENPSCKNGQEYHGYCMDHLPYDLKLQHAWEQTTQEERQKYLDLINAGKSIGDAYKEAGISFEAALEVTNRAIKKYTYLDKKAE